VFFNLLVNAIRYTPHGGTVDVVITHSKHSEGGQSSSLQISIADNGIGIDPEHLPNLFNRFYRTDQARTRNSGGMGLGLAIAREFVIAHGGIIQAQSEPGKGTIFTIQLPY
jgi:two-component system sensor histidine kinase BaeS